MVYFYCSRGTGFRKRRTDPLEPSNAPCQWLVLLMCIVALLIAAYIRLSLFNEAELGLRPTVWRSMMGWLRNNELQSI
jgi:hypothetical protein